MDRGTTWESFNKCSLNIYSMLDPMWHWFQLENSHRNLCSFYIKKKSFPKLYVKVLQDAVQCCLWPCAPLGIPLELTRWHVICFHQKMSNWEAETVSSSCVPVPSTAPAQAGIWYAFIKWINSENKCPDICGQSNVAMCNVAKAQIQMLCDLRLVEMTSHGCI